MIACGGLVSCESFKPGFALVGVSFVGTGCVGGGAGSIERLAFDALRLGDGVGVSGMDGSLFRFAGGERAVCSQSSRGRGRFLEAVVPGWG